MATPRRYWKGDKPLQRKAYNLLHNRIDSGTTTASTERCRNRKKPPRVTDGKLICVDCGKTATCYDHRNYFLPFDVDPVCRSCDIRRGQAYPYIHFLDHKS